MTTLPGQTDDANGFDWGRGSASSAGGPRLIHVPPQVTLAHFSGAGGVGPVTVGFRVPIPDSRLRVVLSLIGDGDGVKSDYLEGQTLKLWLYGAIDAPTGRSIPVTNLDVNGTKSTKAAPVTIPDGPTGMGGYSKEAVTAVDAIEGLVTITSVGDGAVADLLLVCRYQPEAGALFSSFEEWNEIRKQCFPSRIGPVQAV